MMTGEKIQFQMCYRAGAIDLEFAGIVSAAKKQPFCSIFWEGSGKGIANAL